IVRLPGKPQPAEPHFLAMLRRDLAVRPITPDYALLIGHALQVELQAERAALGVEGAGYPYSEQVAQWTGAKLVEGDEERRLGEDLLFAADDASWKEARGHLATAASRYQSIQATAKSLRTSLAVRDQLLAGLPFYALWLAQRRTDKSDDVLLNEVQDLW